MLELMTKIVILLLGAPIIMLCYPALHKTRRSRNSFIIVHAVLLTLATLFLFNQPQWRWSDQIPLSEGLNKLKNHPEAYKYIEDHFVLIDNALNKQLVPDLKEDSEIAASKIITDRKRLSDLLHILNKQSTDIDQVIIDIDLNDDTPDTTLRQELLQLDKKLILTGTPGPYINNPAVYAGIEETGSDNYLVSHQVVKHGILSLPYRIYLKENNAYTRPVWGWRNAVLAESDTGRTYTNYTMNTFFPDFYLVSEKHLRGEREEEGTLINPDDDKSAPANSNNYYTLGRCVSASGAPDFSRNLHGRKLAGLKNIVFIGTFSGEDADTHNTVYGIFHGPTIILNLYYSLVNEQHFISLWYIVELLIGYGFITWFLIRHGLKPEKKESPQSTSSTKKSKLKIMWAVLRDFLSEEAIFLLLFAMIVLVWMTTKHWINGLSLLIYFAVMKTALHSIHKLHAPDNHQPTTLHT